MTDANGVYAFDNLQPGRYRVMAQKAGFATTGVAPPPTSLIEVVAGQRRSAEDFLLERGAVIAGRVLDPTGQPLAEARVSALRRMPTPQARGPYQGSAPLVPMGQSAQTNDLGEFRIYGLPAGEYYVQAAPRPQLGLAGTETPRSTAIGATYYPGSADATGAHTVQVAAGQTLQEVVFSAVVVPVFQVSGVVVDESGAPVEGAMVMLMPDRMAGAVTPVPAPRARSDRQGGFVISNVPNGTYLANAAVPVVVGPDGGRGGGTSVWSSGGASGTSVSGSVMVESRGGTTTQYRNDPATQVRVTVQGDHITNLQLVTGRPQ